MENEVEHQLWGKVFRRDSIDFYINSPTAKPKKDLIISRVRSHFANILVSLGWCEGHTTPTNNVFLQSQSKEGERGTKIKNNFS